MKNLTPHPETPNEKLNKRRVEREREEAEILARLDEEESKRIARNYERETQEMIKMTKKQMKKHWKK